MRVVGRVGAAEAFCPVARCRADRAPAPLPDTGRRSSHPRDGGTGADVLRDRIALTAAGFAPFAVALALVPFRPHLTSANLALILAAVVVTAAALVSPLAAHARTLKLVTDTAHQERIHETASLVQSGRSPSAVVDQVRERFVEILCLRGCCFEHGTLLGGHPAWERVGSVPVGRIAWGLDVDGRSGKEIELMPRWVVGPWAGSPSGRGPLSYRLPCRPARSP